MLACIVVGLLIPDRHAHGFPIGWGRVIHDMIIGRHVFSWGPCLLAPLYHQMHGVTCNRNQLDVVLLCFRHGLGST